MSNPSLRYAVDDRPSWWLSTLLAAQIVALLFAGILITPAIVFRSVGTPIEQEPGIFFITLLICGVTTILQCLRMGRWGSRYLLVMGTSSAYVAVCVAALATGGLPLMMVLILAAALVQFALARHLGRLRRIITPLVGGTTYMLLAVTVVPIAFQQIAVVDAPGAAHAPLVSGVTLIAIIIPSLLGGPKLRLWAPLIGIVVGTAAHAWWFGIDTSRIADAPWLGASRVTWPGLNLEFGIAFWALLPAFLIVTLVRTIETFSGAVTIQQLSHREPRPLDYRRVQSAMYVDGMGKLFAGLLGTVPIATHSKGVSVVAMTGVTASRVGIAAGMLLVLLAFLPKLTAVILSVPAVVLGTYLLVLVMLLFIQGLRMVVADGLDTEKGFIVGLGFWLGMGFQSGALFAEVIPDWLSPILSNGMTVGTLVTLLGLLLLRLRLERKSSLVTPLDLNALPQLRDQLAAFFTPRWGDGLALQRARLAMEEILLYLLHVSDQRGAGAASVMRWELRAMGGAMEIDVAVAPIGSNLEAAIDQVQASGTMKGDDLPLKLLGSIASSVKHHQFDKIDYLSVVVPCHEAQG